jgi:hypothetical protein
MKDPCATCAFTTGSEANLEPHNYLKGIICILGPLPFYCHYTDTGARLDKDFDEAALKPKDLQRLGGRICRGWQREVLELAATGYYKDRPLITKGVALMAREELFIFCNTDSDEDREDHDDASKNLQKAMTFLGDKRRKFQPDEETETA